MEQQKKGKQGFASMDRDKQREIASLGGRAAHEQGSAHQWNKRTAREAGRKGGLASHRNRRAKLAAAAESAPSEAQG